MSNEEIKKLEENTKAKNETGVFTVFLAVCNSSAGIKMPSFAWRRKV